MGQQVLCFVAGAALSSFFVHVGMLATPFFGGGAALWANVLGALILCSVLGELVALVRFREDAAFGSLRAAARLAAVSGALVWLACWGLPRVCRAVLDQNPDWAYAPTLVVLLISVLPGTALATIAPAALRSGGARGDDVREALLDRGLYLVGALVGLALAVWALYRPDRAQAWLTAYATGALTTAVGVVFCRAPGRVVGAVSTALMVALCATQPSEVQTVAFAVGLEDAWRAGRGAGAYYNKTAGEDATLSEAALKDRAERLKGEREKPGVILACELLLNLGKVTVEGAGLRRSLDLLLPPDAKPFLIPIFDQVDEVTSDGSGLLRIRIKRTRGEEGRRFTVPGEKGEKVQFWFKDDFTIKITKERNVWRMAFGPLVTKRAGIFDLHDTNETPVRIEGVALLGAIDACILGLIFEEFADRLVVKALAQGDIGDVKTVEVTSIKRQPRR
jgi:hypothetical protein